MDGSGKDISRGYFMSFDPHAYINAALLEQISPLPARIIPPAKKENSPKKTPVETVHPSPPPLPPRRRTQSLGRS
ncbi:hypothetical protein NIB75_08175 [Bacteroides uniformis]|nr:hypothetical protein [Bacteroides uniformis]